MATTPTGPGLSARARRLLFEAAGSSMPAGPTLARAGWPAVDRFELFLARQPPPVTLMFEALARVFDNLARLHHGRSFCALPEEQRVSYMRSLLAGGYTERMLMRTLLSPLKVAQYDDPAYFEAKDVPYCTEPPKQQERPRHMDRAVDARGLPVNEEIEAEVVIVGSGAGGAALAAELAERGLAVVVLEEGDYFQRKDFSGRAMDMLMAMYRDMGATATLGNCVVPVPFGRCVGGTTTINSGTCYRTPERILRRWRHQYGLEEMTQEALEPHFDKVEKIIGVEPGDPKYVGAMGRVIARGCDGLGYRSHGPLQRNAPDCDGQSLCVFGCPTDAKRSTNVSYIPLALRYGAQLLYNARVTRILTDGERACGVIARGPGGRRILVRAEAVVLSAGSLMTPALLLENRLANSSRQVGRGLSIHPAVGIMALFDEEIRGYRSIPQGYGIEEFHEEGILFEGAFLPPDFLSGGVTLVGPQFTDVMESLQNAAYFGFLIEDTSRGRVRLGPGGRPVMSYLMNRYDVDRLKRGMEILMRVYLAAGARRIFPMLPGFEEVHDMRDVERFRATRFRARDFELTAHHPLGTCRMGRDPRTSVVGPSHETHDVRGLFIVDGSAVPSSLGVNPQVTIMALATRAARFVEGYVERSYG